MPDLLLIFSFPHYYVKSKGHGAEGAALGFDSSE